MLILLALLAVDLPAAQEDLWKLRSGIIPDSLEMTSRTVEYARAATGTAWSHDTERLEEGFESGGRTLIFPLVSRLVAEGHVRRASLYWSNADDPPVSRRDLLARLAWERRFDLYPMIAAGLPVPEDMKGTSLGEQAAAVCSAGWMELREDGLFHPEQMVSHSDLIILAGHFPEFQGIQFLTRGILEGIMEGSR